MVLNINEHEQLSQRVSESPDLLSDIIESAMDAIIAIDDSHQIVLFNAAAEKIFICPANEAIGGSIERFIPQRFRAEHSAHIRRFAESGLTNRTLGGLGTLWGLQTTGEEFPIEASISQIESGGKKFFTVVVRDITQRERSEETLRKSEERFRLAAQAGRMFAYEWDAATDLITRSPESAQILGINEAVLITGEQVLAKVHPDDRERLKDAVTTLSPEKPYLHVRYRMIRPDNTVIWVERSSRAHFDDQGKLLRIVGMVADITERHRTEERLHRTLEVGRIGGWEWDIKSGQTVWFGENYSLLGVPHELKSASEQTFWDRVHPEDRDWLRDSLQRALQDRLQFSVAEFRVVWPDKTVHWLRSEGQFFFGEDG